MHLLYVVPLAKNFRVETSFDLGVCFCSKLELFKKVAIKSNFIKSSECKVVLLPKKSDAKL